jgi:outer membrane protein TolC
MPTANAAAPLSLYEVIDTVRSNHPQILEQLARIRSTEQNLRAIESQSLPSFSVDAGARTRDQSGASLTASMPLVTFGKLESQLDAAREEIAVERARLVQIEAQAVERAALLFVNYLGYEGKLIAATLSLNEQSSLLRRLERRFGSGYTSGSDLRTVRTRVQQAQSRLNDLRLRAQETSDELSVLLNRSIEDLVPLDLKRLDAASPTPDWKSVAAGNAQLNLLRAQIGLANRQVKEQALSDRSTLSLVGQQPFTESGTDRFRVGLELSYNYNNLGAQNMAKVDQLRALVTAKEQELEQSIREIEIRYKSLLSNIRTAESVSIPLTKKLIEGLEENTLSLDRLYQAGRKSLFEVINTYRELSDARIQLAEFETDRLIKRISLLALTGQLKTLHRPEGQVKP